MRSNEKNVLRSDRTSVQSLLETKEELCRTVVRPISSASRSANLTHHITYRSPRSGRFGQRVAGPLYDKERKVYSTMDADAIGQMDAI